MLLLPLAQVKLDPQRGDVMNRFFVAVMMLFLSGCASGPSPEQQALMDENQRAVQQINAWEAQIRGGTLSYSDYYQKRYDLAMSARFIRHKSEYLSIFARLKEVSLAMESGSISKEQFEIERMKIKAERVAIQERDAQEQINADEQRKRAAAAYLKPIPPLVFTPMQVPKQTNCTSAMVGGVVQTSCR